jgi:hypothetical protein
LQNWLYQGFSASAFAGSCTTLSTRARTCSIFLKSASCIRAAGFSTVSPASIFLRASSRMLPMMSVQPSLTRSLSAKPPETRTLKLSIRSCCQPGLQALRPLRIGRRLAPHVDRRRRALEDVELLGPLAQVRHALHGRGAGADDGDRLSFSFVRPPLESPPV